MSSDNKVINGLWISPDGKPLSNLERLCIHSFCANGHDFRLWVYGDIPNIPQDTSGGKIEVCDGNEILSKDKIFVYHNSLAGFSDWFRWELMRQVGGWYVDMDVVCFHPLDFPDAVYIGRENDTLFNSAVMKFPANHQIVAAIADACANPSKIVPWDDRKRRRRKTIRQIKFWRNPFESMSWGEAGGPDGLTRALNHFDARRFGGAFYDFAPISWDNPSQFTDESLHSRQMLEPLLTHSYGCHFYHNAWARNGWDKNGEFPLHSLYETLKRRYLPEFQK